MNTTIEKYLAIVKAHERLILVIVAGLFAVHFYSRGIDYLTNRDQTEAQISHDNAVAASQALVQQQAQFSQQLASIQAQISKRDQQNVVQKQTDDKMSTSELAARIASLISVHPQDVVQSTLPNHLDLDESAAHAVTNALEDGATCKVDLLQTQSLFHDSQSLTNTTQVALDTERKSHNDDVKKLNDKNKTAWLKGFKWGAITAGAAAIGIKIAAHF